jgi:phosphatidylserine/phosphatidylglycerophosphate/cardiolipin synthase-like enzyme
MIELVTLTDGGQRAAEVGERLADWVAAARHSVDIAIYDIRLPGPVGDRVADSLRAAMQRGVNVRIAYNDDQPDRPMPLPPPPRTQPEILASVGAPLRAIPGSIDLMHHKYIVRDRTAVWTGSTNWTLDSWEREENVLITVDSVELAAAFAHDFDQLWRRRHVRNTGSFDAPEAQVGTARMKPWFCPGRGPELSHRIASAIGSAQRRVRIASPVLTTAPVLSTVAQELAEGRLDLRGVLDATQIAEVLHQWDEQPNAAWKKPLLEHVLASGAFSGKRSTPWGPGTVHDFMHAKVTVADDVAFVGSFNLSRSGEQNAENVLEIHDAALAERLAGFIDELRGRYPVVSGRP